MRRPLRDREPTSWTAGEIRALQDEGDELLAALQACWDEYHEVMPDALYEQVKAALGIQVFEAKLALTEEDKAEIDAAYEESTRCQRESWAASQTDVVGGARIDGLEGADGD